MLTIHRYKARVKLIKYCLTILIICALLVIYSMFFVQRYCIEVTTTQNQIKGSNISAIELDNANQSLVINNSILQGYSSRDFLPYQIIATKVSKISNDYYDLENINASYTTKDGSLNVRATEGTFDSKQNFMILKDKINVDLNDMSLSTTKLTIDIDEHDMHSDRKIRLDYKGSSIIADSMKTKNSTTIMQFHGNVKSRITLSDF